MFKSQVVLLAVIAAVCSVNTVLPELVKRSYHGNAEAVVNVTVGEQFSLPLPQFDSIWTNKHF